MALERVSREPCTSLHRLTIVERDWYFRCYLYSGRRKGAPLVARGSRERAYGGILQRFVDTTRANVR